VLGSLCQVLSACKSSSFCYDRGPKNKGSVGACVICRMLLRTFLSTRITVALLCLTTGRTFVLHRL
jgi:hypothetical protein